MRISTFFCFLALPLCSLTGYQEQPKKVLIQPPGAYPAQTQGTYPLPDASNPEPQQKEDDIADRKSNQYEYNLYDRQQNRIDQNKREQEIQQQQQQQYYYQQPAGQSDTGTQYNRTKATRSQFFNPIGDD